MRRKKKILSLIALLLIAVGVTSEVNTVTASAETPYKTYTVDGYGRTEETQAAYIAKSTVIGFGNQSMKNPNDLFVTKDGTLYVADTGNARILIGDADGKLIRKIGEGTLKKPMGIFVTDDKKIYVADHDAEAVFVFDENGNLLNTYGKPSSPLYGEGVKYQPLKVVVNSAGIMFVVCESNTNGVVEISPSEGGTFLGYFGTNYAATSLQDIIMRAILTKEQRAKMVSNTPSTPDNLAIDSKGLIYTVTRGDEESTLKRLNIAGVNMIKSSNTSGVYDEAPAAVAVGNHDNVYVASQMGYIYEYNETGEPLYIFGGNDDGTQRVGLSSLVTSIQVDKDDNIYVLDSDKAQIQIYQPTEFTQKLHNALYLYSKGKYSEARKPLTEVLKMNSMFDYANKAMGRCYFQEEDYESALTYARLAKDKEGYSDAFWETRNVWLKNNIVLMIGLIVLLWIVYKVIQLLDRKKNILAGPRNVISKFKKNKFVSNVCYSGYFMKHPIDGSYGIAREGRASFASASFILVIFMIEYVINKYMCGFLQKTIRDGRYEIFSDVGEIVLVIVALTACNYLVCTINEGEGTIKKIYTYFCYCLLPYVCLTPLNFILSHVVTNNEQFLITLVSDVIICWVAVLAILGIKEVNNYTGKETFKIICLTIFTILIVALLIFIIYVLWAQVIEFISALFGEVVYRLGY